MKKVLTVIALAFAAMNMSAQNMYVGGGVRFESTSDETLFAIQPEVGYQLNDKFGIGGVIGFGTSGSGNTRYSEFIIKPYVRHQILNIGGNVNLFFDYELAFQNAGIKDAKTNTFLIGIEPGLAYNLNSKLSVVTHLGLVGYQSSKLDVSGSKAVNKFTIKGLTQNVSLSLYYNF